MTTPSAHQLSDTRLDTFHVGVAIDGVPTYVVEVPTHLGRAAAERRALFMIAAQPAHRSTDLDRITICEAT